MLAVCLVTSWGCGLRVGFVNPNQETSANRWSGTSPGLAGIEKMSTTEQAEVPGTGDAAAWWSPLTRLRIPPWKTPASARVHCSTIARPSGREPAR